MLPAAWVKRLVDENVEPLRDKHLQWADYVFISAMAIQRKSVQRVVARCRALGVKVVAGGGELDDLVSYAFPFPEKAQGKVELGVVCGEKFAHGLEVVVDGLGQPVHELDLRGQFGGVFGEHQFFHDDLGAD